MIAMRKQFKCKQLLTHKQKKRLFSTLLAGQINIQKDDEKCIFVNGSLKLKD